MAGSISSLGLGSSRKSVQRGVISLATVASGTATITSVDTSKSDLRLLGYSNTNQPAENADIVLTNATTITATRGTTSGTSRVSWELTEYY